jgi:hypothetical protein
MSGGGKSSQTIQKSDPWSGVQPYLLGSGGVASEPGRWVTKTPGLQGGLDDSTGFSNVKERKVWQEGKAGIPANSGVLPEIMGVYKAQKTLGPYQGDLLAQPNAWTGAAQNVALGMVPTIQGAGSSITQYGQDVLSGKYTNPETNPVLQNYMTAATDPLKQQLLTEIMPSISSGSVEAGAYGGSRQGIMEGAAIDNYLRQAGNIRATLAGQTYEAERKAQSLAPSLIQQGIQTQMMAPEVMGNVGQQLTAEDQAKLDAAYQEYQMQATQPWYQVQQLANLIYPAAGFGGTSTGTAVNPTNPVGGAAGGAMAGYQMTGGNPYGAAAGAIMGYMMS